MTEIVLESQSRFFCVIGAKATTAARVMVDKAGDMAA